MRSVNPQSIGKHRGASIAAVALAFALVALQPTLPAQSAGERWVGTAH